MEEKIKLIVSSIGKERFKFNESLKSHTFSKSEGRAESFFVATSTAELVQILDLAHDLHLPYFLIGAGTKVVLSRDLKGVVIKNRTSGVKVAGVKGKVGVEGIGVEEAFVEAESGVSLKKLNEFVKGEKLQEISGFSSLNSTVGGAIFLDPLLRAATQSLRVWNEGELLEIKLEKLKRSMVVLSVIFKFKAKG